MSSAIYELLRVGYLLIYGAFGWHYHILTEKVVASRAVITYKTKKTVSGNGELHLFALDAYGEVYRMTSVLEKTFNKGKTRKG